MRMNTMTSCRNQNSLLTSERMKSQIQNAPGRTHNALHSPITTVLSQYVNFAETVISHECAIIILKLACILVIQVAAPHFSRGAEPCTSCLQTGGQRTLRVLSFASTRTTVLLLRTG